MANSLSRGISFRRQGSSGMSWTDTWSFNEEGVLVRTLKEEVQQQQQRFAGSALARIHDSHDDQDQEPALPFPTCPPTSSLSRSKSVGSAAPPPPAAPPSTTNPSPKFFKWIKRTLTKMKK